MLETASIYCNWLMVYLIKTILMKLLSLIMLTLGQ